VQVKRPGRMVVVVVEPGTLVVVRMVVVEVAVEVVRCVVDVVAMVVVDVLLVAGILVVDVMLVDVLVVGALVVDVMLVDVVVVGILVVDVVLAGLRVVDVTVVLEVVVVLVDVVRGGPSVVVEDVGSQVHSLVHRSPGPHCTFSSPHSSPFSGSKWPSPHCESVALKCRRRGLALVTTSVPVSVSHIGAAMKPLSSLARAGLPLRSSRCVHRGHVAVTLVPPLADLRAGFTAAQPMLLAITDGWTEIASTPDSVSPMRASRWTRKRPPPQGSGVLCAGAATASSPASAVARRPTSFRCIIDAELFARVASLTRSNTITSSSPSACR
jgi:hypothetical protein